MKAKSSIEIRWGLANALSREAQQAILLNVGFVYDRFDRIVSLVWVVGSELMCVVLQ